MAKQTISVGTTANDGTGDVPRTTGQKINANFTELYDSVSGYAAKTANYTLLATDFVINCTSNTFALTLPTAVGITGRVYVLKNSGSGVITISTTSSQTIDGSASGTLTLNQYDSLTVQSDGANWIIL